MANWYSYNGVGDPSLPGSYKIMSRKPNCISGGEVICSIYLNQNSATPSAIDANVLLYIADALGTVVSQPADGFKRFVYVKN